jgi:hypothetical protein
MPYFLGQWFSKQDPEDCNGLFEASMLALLKPWRLLTDLKRPEQTFWEAFTDFVHEASSETCCILKNVQYFHECREHANQHTQPIVAMDESNPTTVWMEIEGSADGPIDNNTVDNEHFEDLISEEDINRVIDLPYSS